MVISIQSGKYTIFDMKKFCSKEKQIRISCIWPCNDISESLKKQLQSKTAIQIQVNMLRFFLKEVQQNNNTQKFGLRLIS